MRMSQSIRPGRATQLGHGPIADILAIVITSNGLYLMLPLARKPPQYACVAAAPNAEWA